MAAAVYTVCKYEKIDKNRQKMGGEQSPPDLFSFSFGLSYFFIRFCCGSLPAAFLVRAYRMIQASNAALSA